MKNIRSYVYAAVLAACALNLAPSLASAQEPAQGKFTLSHDVRWGNAQVPAGEYAFSFDPSSPRVLTLSKISGSSAGFLIMVPTTDESKSSDVSRILLENTGSGSYVSVMQLPQFGITLEFAVPAHPTGKQIAKAATTTMASAQ